MSDQAKVILFNPRSADYNHRIPNSILQVGASITGLFDYVFVDGNMEGDAWRALSSHLDTGQYKYVGFTVMPGPQLSQAIPFSKQIKRNHPSITIVWGGYFASNQADVVLKSGYIDFVVNGPGDLAFPSLLTALEADSELAFIKNLIYVNEAGDVVRTEKQALMDQDELPNLPYRHLDSFYSLENYLAKTFLGNKTLAYHSSIGCPFSCSFCAVVPIYQARWRGKSAENIFRDVQFFKDNYGIDAIEFHDNNFFVAEERTADFAQRMSGQGIAWWGEGRIDTLDRYADSTLSLMREAGCKMIFFGAESGNDDILKQMDKGGKQSAAQIKSFAARMRKFDIIPEYSFVLGLPGANPSSVMQQIDDDIAFIKEIKSVNPQTEIIIYIYSPVPTEGSNLYRQIIEAGFKYPSSLEDWLSPEWLQFDLRKNPLTPWLTPQMVDKIQNFETVLNAYHPTISDFKLTRLQRNVMRLLSSMRYKLNVFAHPYELKFLQKFWLRYRQPEWEGF